MFHAPRASSERPFGRVLTAMVTPFDAEGGLDLDAVAKLAEHLVANGSDGLVVNGTTGESPTLSDAEKIDVLRVVLDTVGDRVHVISGAGSNDTRHTIELAQKSEKAGAHGLLLVTPYYSKPPQAGIAAHMRAVADATGIPIMTYDIPGRSGVPIDIETLVRISEHPRIVANKDAKGDVAAASWAIARSDLAWYSGDDILTLPLLSVGAVGVVSVVSHLVGSRIQDMISAFESGHVGEAAELHRAMLPVFTGIFRSQGVILTKAALAMLGLPSGPVRLPLVDATDTEISQLRQDLVAGGVTGITA